MLLQINLNIDKFKDWEVEWNWSVSSPFIFCFGHPSVELISGVGFYFFQFCLFMFIQFEDEFRRYLPIYIDMLKEVDAMEDTLEVLFSE